MKVKMAYGRDGLILDVPESAKVIAPKLISGFTDEKPAIIIALNDPVGSEPLKDRLRPDMKVLISHSDITRATPNKRILPVLLAYLEENGVKREDITLLNALGTHRPQTRDQLKQMLGEAVVNGYRCVQHDAFQPDQNVEIGHSSYGHLISVNRLLLESDLKIFTGLIEPHFFAGFSGGPKSVVPALASSETIFNNHSFEMIGHPGATFGRTTGNPIWEEMRESSEMIPDTFLLNVTLNREGEITSVFAGDVIQAHAAGCNFLKETNQAYVDEAFDIVLTSNGGYPLDQNLYQCFKGLATAHQVVRKGGAILLVAACEDGMPLGSPYERLLSEVDSPQAALGLVSAPSKTPQDYWQVQIQAKLQLDADVYLYSDGLGETQIVQALMTPCRNVQTTLRDLLGRYGERICVLPEGPYTMID